MGNIRHQRTAHRITSAVNCRPLKPSPRSICPAAPYPTGVHIPGIPPPAKFATRRLQTMPGVGPITAMAIETFAPPMEVFRRRRDFAAWLGLVPLQHSTGGKQVLVKTSMGQRNIRRLLITGAMVLGGWACRK